MALEGLSQVFTSSAIFLSSTTWNKSYYFDFQFWISKCQWGSSSDFGYKITETVIIRCNSSDGCSGFQQPGGCFLPVLIYFFLLQTGVPTSGACSALWALDKNRSSTTCGFCHKFYGQWAELLEAILIIVKRKKTQTLKQTYSDIPQQKSNSFLIWFPYG